MVVYGPKKKTIERNKEIDFDRLSEQKFDDERQAALNGSDKKIVVKWENGESIIASDFFTNEPLWRRMFKRSDKNGIYVLLGGRKCYDTEWVR